MSSLIPKRYLLGNGSTDLVQTIQKEILNGLHYGVARFSLELSDKDQLDYLLGDLDLAGYSVNFKTIDYGDFLVVDFVIPLGDEIVTNCDRCSAPLKKIDGNQEMFQDVLRISLHGGFGEYLDGSLKEKLFCENCSNELRKSFPTLFSDLEETN